MHVHDSARGNPWLWPLALSIITLLAFALRWYYVSTAVVLNPVRGDAIQYYSYAWNLLHHGIFAKDAPGALAITPDDYRDPGYPAFLALWMRALGNGAAWYAGVLIGQAALGALTVTLAMQLGRHWLSPRWTIGAGLLMAVWPHSISINGYLLSETLFGFLCALAVLLCARACQLKSPGWAAMTGTVFGAAALTNAILLPFGLLLAGFLGWRKLAPTRVCVALTVGALLLPGAWAIRNMQISTPESGTSSTDRALQNLVQGSWPDYHSAWRASVLGDEAAQSKAHQTLHAIDLEYTNLRESPIAGASMILRRLWQHPLNTAVWYLGRKPAQLWGWDIQIGQGDIYVYPTKNAPFQIRRPWIALEVICHALNPILLLLALVGMFSAWRRKREGGTANERTALVVVICLLAFVTLVYSLLQAEPRYSTPFRAFELLLAITAIAKIVTRLSDRRRLQSEA
jgi:hypothetical protein